MYLYSLHLFHTHDLGQPADFPGYQVLLAHFTDEITEVRESNDLPEGDSAGRAGPRLDRNRRTQNDGDERRDSE